MMGNQKVLIISGKPKLREALSQLLAKADCQVIEGRDGEEGYRLICDQSPSLVICDTTGSVSESVSESGELLKKLRESSRGSKTYFLALSDRIKMKDYFETIGADDFVELPFSDQDLLVRVKEFLLHPRVELKEKIRKRVLIVGRYGECVEKMAEQLRNQDCHVDFVTLGEQVVSKAVLFLPSVIILESRMIDMGTNTIIKILRHMPQFRKIPILLYSYFHPSELKSGDAQEKDLTMSFLVNTCVDAGADEYIGRYEEEIFIEKVNKYLKKGVIVVIDDDRGIVGLLKKRLEKEGYPVSAAPDAKSGFDLVKKIKPNLILLDVNMPEFDGYDMLEWKKEDFSVKDIPVVMLTVKDEDADIKKGLDLGIVDYVIKPFNMDLLVRKVHTIIKGT